MALRMILQCDAPGCAYAHFEGPWCAWGQGLDPLIVAVVRAGWTIGDINRVYCPEHSRRMTEPGHVGLPDDDDVRALVSICDRLGLDARGASLADVDRKLAALGLGHRSPNPAPPAGPNDPSEPEPARTLRCSACGYAERCPACDNATTLPFWPVTQASEGLRRDVLLYCDFGSSTHKGRAVASIYSVGAAPPVVGIPIALSYSLEEWAALKRAIERAIRQHTETFPPELRAAEAAAAYRNDP